MNSTTPHLGNVSQGKHFGEHTEFVTSCNEVQNLKPLTESVSLSTSSRGGVIYLPHEPVLTNVSEEDKMNVRNVIYCISSLNSIETTCEDCTVTCTKDSYLVTCKLKNGWSIGLPEMQAIVDVNACRVVSVMISSQGLLCARIINNVRFMW